MIRIGYLDQWVARGLLLPTGLTAPFFTEPVALGILNSDMGDNSSLEFMDTHANSTTLTFRANLVGFKV